MGLAATQGDENQLVFDGRVQDCRPLKRSCTYAAKHRLFVSQSNQRIHFGCPASRNVACCQRHRDHRQADN